MNSATYSPEDNKIRLYVGRVPRDEYEKLRAQGWTSTPKQSCDFVATWTPERRATALDYADIIEDEDQGPEDRAADRAERFGEYRDKRTAEATGRADRYDAGPMAHGYQSEARAERAAAHHDRIADRACDAWSKAEYWQRRTAGVIAHALYKSSPGVRMGRIKTLETELRSFLARWDCPKHEISNPRAVEWINHLELRLAYENQMLEAQGGRLEQVEIAVGGKLGGKLILKASKSSVTGRVTSVSVLGPKVDGWAYKAQNIPGTEWAAYSFETERFSIEAYTPPTPESLAELAAVKKAIKAGAPKSETAPLINPTEEDAQRLQDLWNAKAKAENDDRLKRNSWAPDFVPAEVFRLTQAQYSANSGGTYSCCETVELLAGGSVKHWRRNNGTPVAKIRKRSGANYMADRVIILTDKPQKALPAALWQAAQVEVEA